MIFKQKAWLIGKRKQIIPDLDHLTSSGPFTEDDPELAFDALQGSAANLEQGTDDDDDAAAQTNQNLMILGGFVSQLL